MKKQASEDNNTLNGTEVSNSPPPYGNIPKLMLSEMTMPAPAKDQFMDADRMKRELFAELKISLTQYVDNKFHEIESMVQSHIE